MTRPMTIASPGPSVPLDRVVLPLGVELLSPSTVAKRPELLSEVERLLCQHSDLYGSIDRWFASKVLPGIKTGQRLVLVGGGPGRVESLAILKRGHSVKLCHLWLAETARGEGIGTGIVRIAARMLFTESRELHFTFPSSLWWNHRQFFDSLGVGQVRRAGRQYRLGNEELAARLTIADLLRPIVVADDVANTKLLTKSLGRVTPILSTGGPSK